SPTPLPFPPELRRLPTPLERRRTQYVLQRAPPSPAPPHDEARRPRAPSPPHCAVPALPAEPSPPPSPAPASGAPTPRPPRAPRLPGRALVRGALRRHDHDGGRHPLRAARQAPVAARAPLTSGSHGVFRRRLAPLAQLDRASDFESAGRRFESSGARHIESRFRLRRRRGRPNGPAFSAAICTEIPEVRASFAGSASTGDELPAAPHEPSLPGRLAPCLSPSASGGCSPTRGVTVRPRV